MCSKHTQSASWVDYPSASKVLDFMQQMVDLPRQQRMPNLMLIGDIGNGKTSILQRLYTKFGKPYISTDGYFTAPIRLIEAPPMAGEKELYMRLIASLGLPYKSRDSKLSLRQQAIYALREARVRLLLIDDIHEALTGSSQQQAVFMNALKYLSNELMLPIVLCGTKDSIHLLHTHPQHASRFDIAELHTWENDAKFN